jgi:protein-disulfide isomerase
LKNLLFTACFLSLTVSLGCHAQNPTTSLSPELSRRVEIEVRGGLHVPPDYSVVVGPRIKSDFVGYDKVVAVVSKGDRKLSFDYMISADNKELFRLTRYDLTVDPAAKLNIAGRPSRGNPNAKVTVVSFDDLECPYCGRMHTQLFPLTQSRYKDLVRYVYKDFPLESIHPWAIHAAVDANCLAAQNQDAFWRYVDYVHANSSEVNGDEKTTLNGKFASLDKIARQQGAGLNIVALDACLAKQDDKAVRAQMVEAEELGAQGAPFLFVNGEPIEGAVPVDLLWKRIDAALLAEGVQPPSDATKSTPAPPVTVNGPGK